MATVNYKGRQWDSYSTYSPLMFSFSRVSGFVQCKVKAIYHKLDDAVVTWKLARAALKTTGNDSSKISTPLKKM